MTIFLLITHSYFTRIQGEPFQSHPRSFQKLLEKPVVACEQALCLGKKIAPLDQRPVHRLNLSL